MPQLHSAIASILKIYCKNESVSFFTGNNGSFHEQMRYTVRKREKIKQTRKSPVPMVIEDDFRIEM